MPLSGSCHCGAVKITLPYAPGDNPDRPFVVSCNCSFCRKSGSLLAYYPDDGSVRIEGETVAYIWGDRMISQHHCPTCGCFTDWRSTGESHGKVGVNARLLDGYAEREGRSLFEGRELEIRYFDNAG